MSKCLKAVRKQLDVTVCNCSVFIYRLISFKKDDLHISFIFVFFALCFNYIRISDRSFNRKQNIDNGNKL